MINRVLINTGPTGPTEETEDEHSSRIAHEMRRVAAAVKSVNAGRVVPLSEMRAWADSLGTPGILPLPRARRWADRREIVGAPSLADEAAESLDHIEWWYQRPGDGPEAPSVKRVRLIIAALERLAETRDKGLMGVIAGTREMVCQSHRVIYVIARRDPAAGKPGDLVVFDIFGPGQPR
jgi:hypothetical protein